VSRPPQIWIAAAYHPAFRCGGWTWLRVAGEDVAGAAGGERNTTAQRMALAGLVSALRGLGPAASADIVRVRTTSGELASLPDVLDGRAQPEGDLELWAQIATAARSHRLDLARVPLQPETPLAFATAWANLAMDKAKASGPFTAAIPKANLAKAPGLAP
jgi:ribonuclease HI